MKIIVDEMPNNPKDCLFSKRNCEYGQVCKLKLCVCKNTKECACLTAIRIKE